MTPGRAVRFLLFSGGLALATLAVWAGIDRAAGESPDAPAGAVALYRRHCAACHGVGGDGDGLLAGGALRPRSFRREPFRYGSTDNGIPDDADLLRIVRDGIPDSGMPPCRACSDGECLDLVRYVREVRRLGILDGLADGGDEDLEPGEAERIAREGVAPGQAIPVPPRSALAPDPARGRGLFAAHCAACHGALGDGQGTAAVLPDLLGRPVPPRDLTREGFRGGGSDADLFRRIRRGIPGTAMSAFGSGALSDDEVWALVDHLRALRGEAPCR